MSNRIQAEDCAALDIKQLWRVERSHKVEDVVRAESSPDEDIEPTGPRLANIGVSWPNGVWQRVGVNVTLTFPNCGGTRQWFECPGCQRRVEKLYSPGPGQEFRCRHCYRLVYRSQYERLWRHGRYDLKKWVEKQLDELIKERLRNDPAIKLCDDFLRNQ